MICPKCNKLMEQIHLEEWSSENPMTCEEIQKCKCGVTYEFSYGAEHFLDKDGNEIEIE